jgi:class 3 adenylate cyclase
MCISSISCSQFNERAAAVCSTVDTEIASLYESFAGLSGVMTSFAIATNAQWPEFTVPDFDEHVSHVLNLSPTEVFWTSHIVPTEKKGDWESYAVGQSTSFVSPKIYKTADGIYSPVTGPGPYLPIWQQSPAATSLVNFDEMSKPDLVSFMETVNALDGALISPVSDLDFILDAFGLEEHAEEEPHSAFIQPVYDSFDENRQIVAYLQSIISWEEAFSVVIPQSEEGDIHVVLRNSCGQEFTWEVGGEHAEFLGPGDLHQVQYESYKITADLTKYSDPAAAEEAGACQYFFDAYPTSSLRESYRSNKPQTYAAVVGVIFFLMALTFFMYDRFIQRRNEKVINAAARSNAIVAALFPSNVRDRLFAEANEEGGTKGNRWLAPKSGLKDFLATPAVDDNMIFQTKPIADLFPETTIMFADIVGFTAWSSVREPSQVFTLLETVYHAFDMIAKQRRIFKVETVGDCYVAVAGLPEPRKDHAVAMVKFAHECLRKISELTKRLEVELGPDTGDLTIRVGVHSGPVTAGVLRGERSRFQLFGDTMNTASRMESTGVKDKIQISQETADLLIASGKNHWVTPRADTVEAKGKGLMQTYFVNLVKRSAGMSTGSSDESRSSYGDTYNAFAASNLEETELRADGQVQRLMSDKTNRLIDWNCDVLLRLIKQIVAARDVMEAGHGEDPPTLPDGGNGTGLTCLEEVKEIITLPEFDFKTFRQQRKPEDIELGDNVEQQLHDYISNIAIM